MKNSALSIIAGPCSIDDHNIEEVRQIAQIKVIDQHGYSQRAIAGTRIVGIKSRTEFDPSGKGMGIDFSVFQKNMQILANGGSSKDFEIPPSIIMSEEIYSKFNLLIAVEIMSPFAQLPFFEGKIPKGKLLPWNPSVDQLGWPLLEMAMYAQKNGWHIGIKNGKWIGDHLQHANSSTYAGKTTMEKTWTGLVTYAEHENGEVILIHRGVDVPDKGDYRNAIVHEMAKRTKLATGKKLLFDPSHTHGPKLQRHIVASVLESMKMKINEEEYLYDGILIEVGTSTTDTEQHITLQELAILAQELARFRDVVSPDGSL